MEPTCARYPTFAFDGIDSTESSAIGASPIALDVTICPRLRPSLELASPFFKYTFCTSLFPARLLNSPPPNVYLPKLA
ncbi:hypothetical protein PspLS_04554 [Pyricularia sp. CBS 133598]|nr:hypothetical protein PspLS_04554 [Pyricularia sp. CBS 133598]